MEKIQDKEIVFKSLNNSSFKNPTYTFESSKLICIRSYCKMDHMDVVSLFN